MSNDNPEVTVAFDGPVATVEICRPPHNFFTTSLIGRLADAFEELGSDRRCRVIVLAAKGAVFCAGADFSMPADRSAPTGARALNPLYDEAIRLFACAKPVVAAIQGAAIGGGMGLALVADFRVTCREAKFSANFNRLGFHPGFGMSVTVPRLVGVQKAAMLFYTGRRIGGDEAAAIGLADVLVAQHEVRDEATRLAREIASSAPLAVQSTRATLRQGLVDQIRLAVSHECAEQNMHFETADFREGVAAMAARRVPEFRGE